MNSCNIVVNRSNDKIHVALRHLYIKISLCSYSILSHTHSLSVIGHAMSGFFVVDIFNFIVNNLMLNSAHTRTPVEAEVFYTYEHARYHQAYSYSLSAHTSTLKPIVGGLIFKRVFDSKYCSRYKTPMQPKNISIKMSLYTIQE